MTEPHVHFAELFKGRLDAYGTDDGGCARVGGGLHLEGEYQRRVFSHLMGATSMGVYPLMDSLEVHWGCTDLDYTEDPTEAWNLATLLESANINAWVERSRSKGFHVWTFATTAIPATTMRDALLAAHQILGIPPTEVNPKQTSFEGLKGYGNYVRLPYPTSLAEGVGYGPLRDGARRQTVINQEGGSLTLVDFTEAAIAQRTPQAAYERLAGIYQPPPPPKPIDIDEPTTISGTVIQNMSKGTYLAFKYGPRQDDGVHRDRSASLARLAHLCAEDGLTASSAMAVLRDADRRWGKFSERPDCDEQLGRMIDNAYG